MEVHLMQVADRKIVKNKITRKGTFDSPWKKILDRYFKHFMELCWPKQYAEIDWSKGYKMLDKDLIKIDKHAAVGDKTVDKLVEIYCKTGEISYLILHLEIQRTANTHFTQRMLQYRYRLRDLYNKPIASMAVLIDTNPDWRPQIYSEDLWGSWLEMGFPILKVMDYQARVEELEDSTNPFAVVLLAQLAANQKIGACLPTKTTLTRRLYQKGWSRQDVLSLYTFIDWVVALPPELELN
jgi:hypothetical protein